MVRGIPNVTVPPVSYAAAQLGKMSLPVEPASLIYSHFEHVSGVPAPQGTHGVTISKLNLLDVLIGQLNQVKKGESTLSFSPAASFENSDAIIEAYRNHIQQAKEASIPYSNSPSAQSGAVFNLTA